jgi:DNA-binding NarL/FixJ family response regulator
MTQDVALQKQVCEPRVCEIILLQDDLNEIQSLRSQLSMSPSYRLKQVFHNARDIIEYQHQSVALKDSTIFILDVDCLGKDKLETMQSLKSVGQRQHQLMILSSSKDKKDIIAAIRAGASGYLLKPLSHQFLNHLNELRTRGSVLDQEIVSSFVNVLFEKNQTRPSTSIRLSDRELQILDFLANGYQKKEISNLLSISASTVSTHVRHVYEKLEVANAAAAVRKAYELGLFTVD